MSIFGRAVAGAAKQATDIANRYLDAQTANERAKFLAELQRTTAGNIRADADAFENDPSRIERNRTNRAGDTAAAAQAARDAEMAGLTDENYQGARRKVADDDSLSATARKRAEMEALTPTEAARAGAITDAQSQASARYREPKESDGLPKLPPAVKQTLVALDKRESELTKAITEAQAGDAWSPAESQGQRQLQAELVAVRLKRAQLVAPYMPGEKQDADPLGIMGDSKAAEPPAAPAKADKPKGKPPLLEVAAQREAFGDVQKYLAKPTTTTPTVTGNQASPDLVRLIQQAEAERARGAR